VSLVENIGYGKEATHTRAAPGWLKKMKYGHISHITHPGQAAIDEAADRYTSQTIYGTSSIAIKLKRIVKNNALLYNLYKRIS